MTETVVSSATREVVIGFGRPFVMIGERINPTGRKLLAEEMKAGDFSRVEADAVAQVEAGAHMLDVNAGIPLADEPALLAKAIQLVQSVTDVPLSIDSSIIEALEAGLAVYQGKPLVNSTTGEDEVMERVLPLVAKHGAAVVAISNDETGISMDIDVRFAVAKRIVERAADHGIPAHDVVVDPLVMPIGALVDGRPGRLRPHPPAARGAQGQHDVRRLQRQLRAPQPPRRHRRLPVDGDRRRDDVGDHEPAAPRGEVGGDGRRRARRPGPRLRLLDPRQPRPERRRWSWRARGTSPASGMTERVFERGPATRSSVAGAPGDTLDRVEQRHGAPVSVLHRIVFTPSGHEGKVADGASVLDAARQLGVDLDTVCGGRGICGRCQVTPSLGRFAKWAIDATPDALGAPATIELDYHGARPLVPGNRLGCAAAVHGDVVIDVPAASQVHRQVVRKDLDLPPIVVDPAFRLFYVEVPAGGARAGDQRRGRAVPVRRRAARRRRADAGPPPAAGAARRRRQGTGDRRRPRAARSSPSGRATSAPRWASPSTSARPRSPATSATSRPARCWPPPGG